MTQTTLEDTAKAVARKQCPGVPRGGTRVALCDSREETTWSLRTVGPRPVVVRCGTGRFVLDIGDPLPASPLGVYPESLGGFDA
jgi:hypothetical protein